MKPNHATIPLLAVALLGGCRRVEDRPYNSYDPGRPPVSAGPSRGADENIIRLYIKELNEKAPESSAVQTPAVMALINLGPDVIPHVLPLMKDGNLFTRLRAQHVLEGVTSARYGFVDGKGWDTREHERQWRELWTRLGDLDGESDAADRAAAVKAWTIWYNDEFRKKPRPDSSRSAPLP